MPRKKKEVTVESTPSYAEIESSKWEEEQLTPFRAIVTVYCPQNSFGANQTITVVGTFLDRQGWLGPEGWEYDSVRFTEVWRKLLRRQMILNMTEQEKVIMVNIARATGRFLG